jgi:hypothetical protein
MIAHKKPRKSGVFCASSLIEGCGYGARAGQELIYKLPEYNVIFQFDYD